MLRMLGIGVGVVFEFLVSIYNMCQGVEWIVVGGGQMWVFCYNGCFLIFDCYIMDKFLEIMGFEVQFVKFVLDFEVVECCKVQYEVVLRWFRDYGVL